MSTLLTIVQFTVQSDDEYLRLRKAMCLYAEYGNKCDNKTMAKIAEAIGTSIKTVSEILLAGLRNMQFIDYFCKYVDEDSEESREEVASDSTAETDKLFFQIGQAEKVMSEFESLNFRERAIVSAHLGFCMKCYST